MGPLPAVRSLVSALILVLLLSSLSSSITMHKVVADLQSGCATHESRLFEVEANMTEVVIPHINRVTQAFAMPSRSVKGNP